MKNHLLRVIIVFSILMLTSCSATQNPYTTDMRPAENVPEQFLPVTGVVLDATSCKSPLIDPRDGTELTMVGSQNGLGLYRVSELKYGLRKGEVLKINCADGRVQGIVKGPK